MSALATILLQDIANQFNNYLALGYFVMWVSAMAYVISLYVRQRNLKQDIDLMKRILEEERGE